MLTSSTFIFSSSFFLQIHGINGMIDQYYVESLPHLLQELDDVYHDVSAVVLESLTEGSNKITEKVGHLLILMNMYGWEWGSIPPDLKHDQPLEENLRRCSGYFCTKGNLPKCWFSLSSCHQVLSKMSNPNLNFSAGYLLLPLLHHHSWLCANHKAQLPPAPNERPRKRKYLKL